MPRTKIAIACQGGGSQTAFTAGVLSAFFEKGVHREKQIVSLSGTSGGAVCAVLAWYGLLRAAQGDTRPIQDRIRAFWQDISARMPPERYVDQWGSDVLRLIEQGSLSHLEISPVSMLSKMFLATLSACLPRSIFLDLKVALEAHIEFGEIPRLTRPDSPVLLVGAADVLTGELKKFNSREGEICLEAILASAAVPTLFEAVELNGHYYWDGLFSDNPPVKELLRLIIVGGENIPDELWVIQINPTAIDSLPKTNSQITDRRNQMEGNVSLQQSLEFVEFMNLLLREKLVNFDVTERWGFSRREPFTIRMINMSPELQASLNYVSKLSRDPAHIQRLMEDGEAQGRAFLDHLATGSAAS